MLRVPVPRLIVLVRVTAVPVRLVTAWPNESGLWKAWAPPVVTLPARVVVPAGSVVRLARGSREPMAALKLVWPAELTVRAKPPSSLPPKVMLPPLAEVRMALPVRVASPE